MPPSRGRPTAFTALLLRHMQDDLNAYGYDRDYCSQQLLQERDLTPQEARTLRLRVFDLNHQIRLAQHKIEVLNTLAGLEQPVQSPQTVIDSLNAITHPPPSSGDRLLSVGAPDSSGLSLLHQATQSTTPPEPTPTKRSMSSSHTSNGHAVKRLKKEVPGSPPNEEVVGSTVQRLGYWKCRLCTSAKYATAPQPKQPSAACKWPLRDVAKMITHFTDMHGEHTPSERCHELGSALNSNREFAATSPYQVFFSSNNAYAVLGGPFEYWLNRSRSQDVGDGSILTECIDMLQGGRLPPLLRKLSRAAAAFPEDDR